MKIGFVGHASVFSRMSAAVAIQEAEKLGVDTIFIDDPIDEKEEPLKPENKGLPISFMMHMGAAEFPDPYLFDSRGSSPAEKSQIKEAKKTAPKTINRHMRHKHIRRK